MPRPDWIPLIFSSLVFLVSACGPERALDPGETSAAHDPADANPDDTVADDTGDDPDAVGVLSLYGDPRFDPDMLSADETLWVGRLNAALERSAGTARARAGSGDLYLLGRYVGDYVAALLAALRATGDLAYLDRVLELSTLYRADLADAWLDGTEDGFLNWLWLADPASETFYGKDTIPLDEAMTHGNVALVAYAFHVNRDIDPTYAEAADFWVDYLEDHFLAKWTSREGGDRLAAWTDGFYKRFTHPRGNQLRLAHYLHACTGDPFYGTRAQEIASELAAHAEPNPTHPDAYRWTHQVAGTDEGWQKINYAQYVMRVLIEMSLEGVASFDDADVMARYASTFRDVVFGGRGPAFDTMAERVDGSGSTSAGVYGLAGLGRWDETGTLLEVAERHVSDGSAGVSVAAYALMAVSNRQTGSAYRRR